MLFFAAVDAPWGPESMKFPVNSLLAGNSAFRDGFARDCLLQRGVRCEPQNQQLASSRHAATKPWPRLRWWHFGRRPSFYAFSYTVPSANSAARSFVAAGSGEAREGGLSYEGGIIRRGDQSPEAMCEKARFVLGAMEQRMAALGFGWAV